MSQDGAEFLLRFVDALNRRDLKDFLALCHLDVEFRSFASDLGGTFRGHVGMRRYFHEFTDTFDQYHIEIERVEDRGDVIVGRLRGHARARASGVEQRPPPHDDRPGTPPPSPRFPLPHVQASVSVV